MPTTYTASPKTSTVDALRLLIGDVNVADATFTDDELLYFYELADSNKYLASYEACQSAASKYARLADKSMGPMQVSYSQIAIAFRSQAEAFFARATSKRTTIPTPSMTVVTARFGYYDI